MLNFTILQANPVAGEAMSMSYLDLAAKGGIIMIPIALLSVVAVYVLIDRIFVIRKMAATDVNFMNRIKDYIHDDKLDSAIALCQSTNTILARMIEKGLSRIGRPLNDIHASIENVGRIEIAKLEKGLPWVATAAGGAPMLGFLGTVTGMVRAFYDMANAGAGIDIDMLSTGIYEALITTVGGLVVGIPAYFAYNYLVARIGSVINNLEARTTEFMDILNEPVN